MKYKLNKDISIKKVDSDIFILNRETSKIHYFNETGACIWKLLQENKSINDLPEVIAHKFDVSCKEAGKDLQEFLDLLKENNLITITGIQ